jgi:hypothetical protein
MLETGRAVGRGALGGLLVRDELRKGANWSDVVKSDSSSFRMTPELSTATRAPNASPTVVVRETICPEPSTTTR